MNGFDRGGVMMLCGLQKNDGIILGKNMTCRGKKEFHQYDWALNRAECQRTECVAPAPYYYHIAKFI